MMKKLIAIILTGIAIHVNAATRPDIIPSKLTEVKSNSWYMEKFRSWKSYLEEQPADREGWLEYFKAGYYGNMPQTELTLLSEEIATRFADGFESHYVKSKLLGWSEEGISNLKKSLILASSKDLLPERILIAELLKNDRAKYTQLLYNSNTIYPSLLNYSYNVLMSVGENGILFTEGENTTIPLWILQDVMNVRKDVSVLNIELLSNNIYREGKFQDLGMQMESNDLSTLPALNPQLDFYYALTLPRKNLEEIENRLYVVGLTSKHSNTEIDNYTVLKENIEERFLLDYLTVDFNGEPKTATGRTLEPNYIVPFMLLKQYYDQVNDTQRAEILKNNILTIADRSQIKSRVVMLMKSSSNAPKNFAKTELDVKKIDAKMTKVKDNIYASIFETTNLEYEVFLDYLKENGHDDLHETAFFDLSKYDDMSYSFMKQYHIRYNKISDKPKPNFLQFPTMDITYDAAKLYCEWLTTQYNLQDGRKFKKVKFRLPTRKEWTMAALGYVDFQTWEFEDNIVKARPDGDNKPRYFEEYRIGDFDSVSYPWYHSDWFKHRNAIKNDKGCYLANIKSTNEKCVSGRIGDGFMTTSPVGAYFSSDMGLYDVIGNVAEMIDEEGVAMGGSWNHVKEEATITSINKYDKAAPSVGFRIFMEVIEE